MRAWFIPSKHSIIFHIDKTDLIFAIFCNKKILWWTTCQPFSPYMWLFPQEEDICIHFRKWSLCQSINRKCLVIGKKLSPSFLFADTEKKYCFERQVCSTFALFCLCCPILFPFPVLWKEISKGVREKKFLDMELLSMNRKITC